MTKKKASKKKTQSFGGIRVTTKDVSPKVVIGKKEIRKESKIYNFKLSFEHALRLQHSLGEAAKYLSEYREDSVKHENGIRLVINFETGRIDFQRP
jgi:hypothetical protein